MKTPVVVVAACVAGGCSAAPTQSEVVCAPLPSMRFAATVTIEDSVSGQRAPFSRVEVLAVDGAYNERVRYDSIAASDSVALHGINLGADRPGMYTLVVLADGYAPWSRANVAAAPGAGACGVNRQLVVARLQRE
jgi:hypothetical protein